MRSSAGTAGRNHSCQFPDGEYTASDHGVSDSGEIGGDFQEITVVSWGNNS